ncbi:MAG: DMT family transporter [Chloroflexota bacterium]
MTKPSWRPYIVLGVGLLAVSSASIMIRFAQQEQSPPLVISAWRVGLAALVLTPIVLTSYRAQLAKLSRSDFALAMLAGLFLGAHFASWVTSLEYTSVINSVVLVTTNPLWVALAAPFVLREKLSRTTLIAVFLAIAGGIVVSIAGGPGTAPHQNSPLLGDVLAIIGAIAVSGYFLIGRQVRGRVSLIPYVWLTYGSAAIVLSIAVLLTGQQVGGLSNTAYLWMTLLALVPQLIGHSAYNYALGYLSAAYVALTVLGEIVGSAILAALFLNEQPVAWQLVGGVLIMLALILASREEAKATRELQKTAVESAVTL